MLIFQGVKIFEIIFELLDLWLAFWATYRKHKTYREIFKHPEEDQDKGNKEMHFCF